MSAYVDGELTGMEMLEIRQHLSECADCAEEHESVRFVKQAVSRLATVAPHENFAASILGRLNDVSVPTHQRLINNVVSFLHKKVSPVAAALAASGLALVLLSAGGMDTPSPQPQSQVASPQAFGGYVRTASYLPELPGGHLKFASYEPVRVADGNSELGGRLELASLSIR